MKYLNFNYHQELDPVQFKNNKKEYFANNRKFLLTEKDLAKPCEKLVDGYAICEEEEIILDTDSEEATAFVEELIEPFKEKVLIEKTKNGKHFYIKTHFTINGKKDLYTANKGQKIELKGKNSWVFTSNNGLLKEYYKYESGEMIQLTDEESLYLFHKINNLLGSSSGVYLAKNSRYLPERNELLKKCVKEVVLNEGKFTHLTTPVFFRCFHYLWPDGSNIYNWEKIKKGNRQNFLHMVLFVLSITADIEDVEEIMSFLKSVNNEFIEEPLDDKYLTTTLGAHRLSINGGSIPFFTLEDLKAVRKEFAALNIYQEATKDQTQKDVFYIIKKQQSVTPDDEMYWNYILNYGEIYLLIRKIAPGEKILIKEIKTESHLAAQYLIPGGVYKSGPKEGMPRPDIVKYNEIEPIYFNMGQKNIDPFRPVETSFYNGCLCIDFSTQHYSSYLKKSKSNPDELISEKDFLEIPYVKMAIDNIFSTKERLAMALMDIRKSILTKTAIKTANVFSGPGGIGKDAFMDFIADCFLQSRNGYYKIDHDRIKKGSQFNFQLADAAIWNLNESGASGSNVDERLLSALNSYIDSGEIMAEEKFQVAKKVVLHAIFMGISTNSMINVGRNYNQTRFRFFICPGLRPLRNNDKNSYYYFKGLSSKEIAEKYAQDFVNFVLYAPILEEWAKNGKDDSEEIRKSNEAVFEDTPLGETFALIDEMKRGNFKTLIENVESKEWKDLPKNEFENWQIKAYCVLALTLGMEVKYLEKYSLLRKKSSADPKFNPRNDTKMSSLAHLQHWIQLCLHQEGRFESKEKCFDIYNNDFYRPIFINNLSQNRCRVRDDLITGYRVVNDKIIKE